MIRTLMRPLRQWVFFLAMFAAITLMPIEAIKHMYAYPDEVAAALYTSSPLSPWPTCSPAWCMPWGVSGSNA